MNKKKVIEEVYMGGFQWRKGKGKLCNYNLKNIKTKMFEVGDIINILM